MSLEVITDIAQSIALLILAFTVLANTKLTRRLTDSWIERRNRSFIDEEGVERFEAEGDEGGTNKKASSL